jgi:metal-sulfur cluster biosynthetic enzyme
MNATAVSEASSTVTNAYIWTWFKLVSKPELADWLNNMGIVSIISIINKTLRREYKKLLSHLLLYSFTPSP